MNEATPVVSEYLTRLRLAKIGYTSDMRNLSVTKGEAFLFISQELDRLESEEMKRKAKRR